MAKTKWAAQVAIHPNPLFQRQRDALKSYFVERAETIDGLFIALIARQNAFLLGPPGVAKSALVRAVADCFGLQCFEWLLTKFTTPDEIFGPLSISKLKQDVYMRITTGKLPEAEIFFGDELWKASSSIANTLLTAINERLFHNGAAPTHIPLVSLIGASNELPEDGGELEALWDRLAMRFMVKPVIDPESWKRITFSGVFQGPACVRKEELWAAQAIASASLAFSPAMMDVLDSIRLEADKLGITASNRRWKSIAAVVRATCALDGAAGITLRSFRFVPACLWHKPEEIPKVTKLVLDLINPALATAKRFLDEAKAKAQALRVFRGTRAELVSQAAGSTGEIEQMKAELGKLVADATEDQMADLSEYITDLAKCAEEVSRLGLDAFRTRKNVEAA